VGMTKCNGCKYYEPTKKNNRIIFDCKYTENIKKECISNNNNLYEKFLDRDKMYKNTIKWEESK
jgi:hypothetical protein